MKKLMFAELIEGVTFEMMEDKHIHIISDTGIFLITTPKHTATYPELEFFEVDPDSYQAYELDKVLNEEE